MKNQLIDSLITIGKLTKTKIIYNETTIIENGNVEIIYTVNLYFNYDKYGFNDTYFNGSNIKSILDNINDLITILKEDNERK